MRKLVSIFFRFIAQILEIISNIFHKLSLTIVWWRFRFIDFQSRSSDIFIVTYPRSGTTWMQNILYQMTSAGDLNFNHISEKIPWFEFIPYLRRKINDEEAPRIFKTHLTYKKIPKGSKYIYVHRNGIDVAISYFKFYQSHRGFKGTFNQFFNMFLNGRVLYKSWFKNVFEWYKRADKTNVLFVSYSDLKNNFEQTVKAIADFIEIDLYPDKLNQVVSRCSFEFMKKNEEKFDAITELLLQQGIKRNAFIREGKEGAGIESITDEQKKLFNTQYKKVFGNDLIHSTPINAK